MKKGSRSKKEIEINSLSTLIKYVEDKCQRGFFLFRGQREDKDLLPKIARDGRNSLGEMILRLESEMLDEFKRQCLPYLEVTPRYEWDWLALAQHHGMPTRLLSRALGSDLNIDFSGGRSVIHKKVGPIDSTEIGR